VLILVITNIWCRTIVT